MINIKKMNSRILKSILVLIFLILFQIPVMKENELNEKNESLELRNLEQETFGSATLYFSSIGTKILVNVNNVFKENLLFYLKSGDNLTKIPNSDLIEISSNSSILGYKVKNILYTLNNKDNEIVVKFKIKPNSLEGLFALSQANKITLENFHTENVKSMAYMFLDCQSLTQLEISEMNTSRVTTMYNMFYNCEALTQLNISNWNTSNVKIMSHMFHNCLKLTQLDVTNWDISTVTKMDYMFWNCKKLTQLDVSKWSTSKVEDMGFMFTGCNALTQLNVSKWNTSSVTSMFATFYNCKKLTQLDISKWDTSKAINMYRMFYNCQALTQLNVSNWNTSSVTNMNSLFYNCQTLTQLDVSNWDTSKVTNMDYMFYNCQSLIVLDLSDWSTSNVINLTKMFYNCEALKDLNIESFKLSQINKSDNAQYFLGNDENLEYCRYSEDTSNSINQYYLRDCSKLISFKKCGTCNINSNNTHCVKTLIFSTGDGTISKNITKIFHYLKEEKSINDKTKKSCYWIEGFEKLSYFNLSFVDKYNYIKCDDSCRTCELFDLKMCRKCRSGFFSLFNETLKKRKHCYSELTDEHFYLYNLTEFRECPSECRTCDQKLNESSINCLTCYDENHIIFNGSCIKKQAILIKETLSYTYEELKNNKLYYLLSNYSNIYYNDSNFIQQFINDNITLTLYNVGVKNMNNTYLDQLKLDIFKVNLSDCYEKIIKKYNITEDLVYGQIDFKDNSNKIYYILYDPKTNKIINMDICENMEITVSKNIELTEELKNIIINANEQGYNIADINDPFYNDVCTSYTTSNGTDITITDRITDIYGENFGEFINYDECNFESFNLNETSATLICKSKTKSNNSTEDKNTSLDIKQILNNFNFYKSSNFYVVTCYKKFFSKEGQSNNYANYIYYVIFALIFILLIIYFFTGVNYLKAVLSKIAFRENFAFDIKQKSMQNQIKKRSVKKSDFILNSINNGFLHSKNQSPSSKELYISVKDENQSNPLKRKSRNEKKIKSNINKNGNKNLNSRIILIKEMKINIKNVGNKTKNKNNINKPIELISLKNNEKNKNVLKNIEKEKIKSQNFPETKIENQSIENKKKKIEKISIKEISEVGFNEFDYVEALQYDKRTFIQLYFSYIRLKHPIFYLFYDDYNITTMKFILFLHSFATHVCTNGLFFYEETMHQVYKDNGNYNFIYRLPFNLYSVFISSTTSILLKKLVLTQNHIIEYKKEVRILKKRSESFKKAFNIIKYYKIKFTAFVISIILTLVSFWFYIGCFCTVYRNTQLYLLKDSLIGFGISMLYPIGILLIACLFRIFALKKNSKCLFRISKIIA